MFRKLMVATVPMLAFALAAISTGAATAQDTSNSASGTWKWTIGKTRKVMMLRLTQEGDNLTGVLIGSDGHETVIEDGKYNNGVISFKVTGQLGKGMKLIVVYAGRLSGDTIIGGLKPHFGRIVSNPRTGPIPWQARRVEE